jgi:enoyl-CoA hydratase/carnithine racemase
LHPGAGLDGIARMPLIPTEFSDGVGTITFQNLAKRNCLSSETVSEILSALDFFEQRQALAAVIRAPEGILSFQEKRPPVFQEK